MGFAKILLENINGRFPNCGVDSLVSAAGNYLDPVFQGVHLVHFGQLENVKRMIEEKWGEKEHIVMEEETSSGPQPPLSPTSKLIRAKNRSGGRSGRFFTNAHSDWRRGRTQ